MKKDGAIKKRRVFIKYSGFYLRVVKVVKFEMVKRSSKRSKAYFKLPRPYLSVARRKVLQRGYVSWRVLLNIQIYDSF